VEYGEYTWKNFGQVKDESLALARYLYSKGLCPKNKFAEYETEFRLVALYSKNREEWVTSDFACMQSAITTVTLYDTLGKESIEYILDQTQIKTVICQGDKVNSLIKLKKEG
jgi:long-chain acyl-CoA synthetase